MRNRIFSTDSPKAIKADKYGYLNAIHYMAPADLAGVGNLCPFLSTGCKALCLGAHSGAATYYPSVLQSRIASEMQTGEWRSESGRTPGGSRLDKVRPEPGYRRPRR